jgi:plastocyanin
MRKNLILLPLAAIAIAITPAATADTAATVAVSITKAAFVPKNVTATVNDTVKWTNNDTANHQVVCAKCPFTSPILKPGESFSYKVAKTGKFPITDALASRLKGTVTVKAAGPSVTLAAKPATVTYGAATTLSGKVSTNAAGEKVVVLGQECGKPVFSSIATVNTTGGGNFSTTAMPAKNTTYQAKWKTSTSPNVAVKVRPRIQLAKLTAHKYRVRVRAAESFAGKLAEFQRFNKATGTWVRVRRVALKAIAFTPPTQISGATFRSKIKAGRKVRILLRTSQVAPCYVGGHSNVIKS